MLHTKRCIVCGEPIRVKLRDFIRSGYVHPGLHSFFSKNVGQLFVCLPYLFSFNFLPLEVLSKSPGKETTKRRYFGSALYFLSHAKWRIQKFDLTLGVVGHYCLCEWNYWWGWQRPELGMRSWPLLHFISSDFFGRSSAVVFVVVLCCWFYFFYSSQFRVVSTTTSSNETEINWTYQ